MEFACLFPQLKDEENCAAEIMGYVMCADNGVRDFYNCLRVCKAWNECLKEDHFYFQLANTQITYEGLIQKYNRFWTEKQTSNPRFWREYVPLMLEEQKTSDWVKIKEDLAFYDKETLIAELVEFLEERASIKPEKRNKEADKERINELALKHGGCWTQKTPFNQYADWTRPLMVPGWNSILDQVNAAVKILTYKHLFFVNLDRIFCGKNLIGKKESLETTSMSNIKRTVSTSYSDFSDVDKVLVNTIKTVLQYNNTNLPTWVNYCAETICWYFQWICYGANECEPIIKQMVNVRLGNIKDKKPTENDMVELVDDIKTLVNTAIFNPAIRRNLQSKTQNKQKLVEITRKMSEELESKHREMSQFRKLDTIPSGEFVWSSEQKQALFDIVHKKVANKELATEISERMASHMSPDQVIGTNDRFLEPEIEWEKELIEQTKEVLRLEASGRNRLEASAEIAVI